MPYKDRATQLAYWKQYNAARLEQKREYMRVSGRLYKELHPAQRTASNANRAARYLGTERIRAADLADLPTRCAYCGATENLTVDHIIPPSRGGRNHRSNLTTACFTCNRRKRDRTPSEFAEYLATAG